MVAERNSAAQRMQNKEPNLAGNSMSKIEWTDRTWNPVTGCDKISAGCDHCYAEAIAENGFYRRAFPNAFRLTLKPDRLQEPLRIKTPSRIFVNSMSDLFHKGIPSNYIDRVFDTMETGSWHTYQVLTKRSSLMRDYVRGRFSGRSCPEHLWLGVSVEDRSALTRLRHLQQTPAVVRFLSVEPLLEALGPLNLDGISWVIVGGESARKDLVRVIKPEWAREIRDQCVDAGVPFFFKQWGGHNKRKAGRLLDGRTWDEFPVRPRAPFGGGTVGSP